MMRGHLIKKFPLRRKIWLLVKFLKYSHITGWPTKMSLFLFGNNFYKNKKTFKIFSPQFFFSDDVPSCLWIVFTNSVFQIPLQKKFRRVEILGIGWPGVIGLTWNESVPWEVMPEVFKCSVQGGGLKWGGASFLEQNTWIPQA